MVISWDQRSGEQQREGDRRRQFLKSAFVTTAIPVLNIQFLSFRFLSTCCGYRVQPYIHILEQVSQIPR